MNPDDPFPHNPPLNKPDFYKRWFKGEFGNTPHKWQNVGDIPPDFHGRVSIRSMIPGGVAQMKLPIEEIRAQNFETSGRFMLQQSMPDEKCLLQGTLTLTSEGLLLEYSLEQNLDFRRAMMEAYTACGFSAVLILRRYVDPASLDDIYSLLERYRNAIIEFATYAVNVGMFPHRNTVIFEVRAY